LIFKISDKLLRYLINHLNAYLVAKRKSLFDDKPVEIQELTYIIKEDINSLNKQIAQLQQIARGQQGHNGRQTQTHSNTVVVALQVINVP